MANKRECLFCGKFRKTEDMFITPLSAYCSIEEAFKYAKKPSEAGKKKLEKLQRKDKKESRDAARTLKKNNRSHQFVLTKRVIQKWVNHVRDEGLPCISCGTTKPDIIYSGGHYKTAGGNPEIALESKNIHRQCLNNCNKNKSGNIEGDKHSKGFKKGLIDRYGPEYVDWLDGPHKSQKLDCGQLIELRAYYNKLIREHKKTDEDKPRFS